MNTITHARADQQGHTTSGQRAIFSIHSREPRRIALARAALTAIGQRMTPSGMYWLERVMSQLEVGRWFRERGWRPEPLYADRGALYAALARDLADERVLYLEFGVFRGDSMRAWSQLLSNPATQLHGFDAFAGLPETWNHFNPQGEFATEGRAPRFEDPRISLHTGWFQDTLPRFRLPPHERLIVHCDADLYSSTAFVLAQLADAIGPGDILLFDEFYDRQHELRAFSEFLDAASMTFRYLGGATHLSQCAFERIA
jgi:hypothetical protein